MSDPDGPRLATPEDYPEMTALLDRYFAKERGGMEARLPFAYDRERCDRHAIVVEDGRVVSHVAAVPQTLSVGSDDVECWGIGGVATDRRYRGEGHMRSLMEFWLDRMDEQDVPLSDLSGDRQRYGHYDYEMAGTECRFRIDDRSYDGEPTAAERVVSLDDTDDLHSTVREIHEAEPHRVVRDWTESRTVLGKRGLETLVYLPDAATASGQADDAGPAYVSLTMESRSRVVEEFGGSADSFDRLLGHLLAVYDLDELTVRAPPWHSLEPVLARHSRFWSARPHRKLRICDFPAVLNAFGAQLEERWVESGHTEAGEVVLGVEDGGSVGIGYGPDGVSVESATGAADVELDRRTVTSLLFGMEGRCSELRSGDPFLESVLPLRFFVWPSEHV